MSEMRSEEEQIEAIKNWWKENGTQTIAAVALVVAGWGGFNFYQNQQQSTGEAASVIYQQVLELSDTTEEADKGQRAQLLDQLKGDYASTTYAKYAALFKAKDAIDAGDLDMAAEELSFVKDNAEDLALKHLATVRLARVLKEQEKLDEALALVDVKEDIGAFKSEYAEVQGDILYQQGKRDAAREAYQAAKEAAQKNGTNNPDLEMKLNDLAVAE